MKKPMLIIFVFLPLLVIIGVILYYIFLKMPNKKNVSSNAKGEILMIIAPKDFRDEELKQPKEAFENAGYKVTIASKGVRQASGMLGGVVSVDVDIKEVDINKYLAVVFVGGSGASVYFGDPDVLRIAKEAVSSDKVVGAICIAPSILANAGVLEGKRVTSFPSEEENIKSYGGIYTGEKVSADGNIITAKGPEAASEFGSKMVELLNQKR
jgi:protease I